MLFCIVVAVLWGPSSNSVSAWFEEVSPPPRREAGRRCSDAASAWPAPGSEDTELGVLMELEVGHGETEVHPGIQA